MGSIAAFHRVEDLVPGGAADRLRMGEERLERDVRKGSLHALIGGAVPAQYRGLVLLGHIHHVLYVVAVIGAQGGVLNARFGLVQHHGFPRGIEDRQTVGLFVFGDRQHSRHPPLEQRGQRGVHRVDLPAGFVQCVHGFHILCFHDSRDDTRLVYHNPDTETTNPAPVLCGVFFRFCFGKTKESHLPSGG